MGKQGRLCEPRQIELLFRIVKGKLRNVVTKNVAGLCIDFFGDSIFVIQRSLPIPGY